MWDQVLPMNEIGDRLLPVPYNYDFGYLPNLLSLLQKGIESWAIPVGCWPSCVFSTHQVADYPADILLRPLSSVFDVIFSPILEKERLPTTLRA